MTDDTGGGLSMANESRTLDEPARSVAGNDAGAPSTPAENRALNKQEQEEGRVVVLSRPIRVSMNMTGKCNIRCIYCHLTFADYFTKDELEERTFKQLAPFFPTLSHLVYFASTEPLGSFLEVEKLPRFALLRGLGEPELLHDAVRDPLDELVVCRIEAHAAALPSGPL